MNRLKDTTRLLLLAPLFSILASASLSTLAQNTDPIGRVLSTSGSVIATGEDGSVRELQRRSMIYKGDVITTALRSRIQIRFNDNGLVALRPETRFLIEEHIFNGVEDGNESASYRLLSGGLQAMTGLIGNKNKNQYRFETPLATIGLRGTHWGINFCDSSCGNLPPGLYGGVAEGGIDVCNGGGCEGFDKDGYFYVPDENTKPQVLLDPPSAVFDDTTGRDDEEEDDGEDEGDDQQDDGDGQSGSGESEGNDGQAQGGNDQQGDDDQGSDGTGADSTGENTDGSTTAFGANADTNTIPDQSPDTDPTTETEFDQQEAARDQRANEEDENNDEGSGTNDDGGNGGTPFVDDLIDASNTDTDGDGISDVEDPDADGDGVLDSLGEIPSGFVAIDTDGDGILDEFAVDTDRDGVADINDPDADGNGILDSLGAVPSGFLAVDTDGDGIADEFVADTDNDGIADAEDPDADGNGILDELGEVPSGFAAIDTDGDGIAETLAADTDNDGIVDTEDPDADGNGILDELGEVPSGFVAIDTDGDGIADSFAEDTDGDGIANSEDIDADGNGVLDSLGDVPAGFIVVDTDDDGIADTLAPDADSDGIADSEDPDADGNGILDELGEVPSGFVAIDTDGDGIADTFAEDTDGDGIANAEDTDADGDGVLDELGDIPPGFVALDTDGDGIADTLGADSDGDGIADINDPTPNGVPTPPAPDPDPEPVLAVAIALVSDRATDSGVSDVFITDEAGNTVTDDTSGNVTGSSIDNDGDCDPCLIEVLSSATLAGTPDSYTDVTDNIDVLIGRWTGETTFTENGVAQPSSSNFHFAVTEDFSDAASLSRSVPIIGEYSLAMADGGGNAATLPTDGDGNTGTLAFVDLSFDFHRQLLLDFELSASFAHGDYFASLLDPVALATGAAGFSDLQLFGHYDSCGGCILDFENAATSFVFLGDTGAGILGSYQLNTGASATSIAGVYVLELGNEIFVFDRTDNSVAPTNPMGSVAAVANITAASGVFASYAGVATNDVTGSSLELVALDSGAEILVSAYDTGVFAGSVDFGNANDFSTHYLGPNEDVTAYWGIWEADQTFFNNGVQEDVTQWLPFAHSEQAISTLPMYPITGFGPVHYSLSGGKATNQDGLLVTLDSVSMNIDFFGQQIIAFDLTASFVNILNTINYIASNIGVVDLIGVDASDILIPLAGSCTGCDGDGSIVDLVGSTSLALIGSNGEGAIGAFQLDSLTSIDGSYSGSRNDLYSLAGAYVLEQQLDFNHWFDAGLVSTMGAPNNGVGFGATILFNDGLTPGVTSASGYATLGIEVVDAFLEGSTPENAIVGGSFLNFDCSVSGDCLDVELDQAELSQIDEISSGAYTATLGRWQTFDEALYLDDSYSIEEYFHFAFSTDETIDVTAVNSIIVKYDIYASDGTTMIGAYTDPTDQNGNSGYVNYINMEVDFLSQQITAFNIEAGNGAGAGTGGFEINAWLPAPVALGGSSVHSFGLVGLVTDEDSGCTVNCLNDSATGIVNTAFLGDQAEAVLGAYNLAADTIESQLAGTFLLESLQASNPAPAGAVALTTGLIDAGTGTSIAGILTGTGKTAISISGVVDVSTVGTITHDSGVILTENAVVSGVVGSELSNLDAIGEDIDPPTAFDCNNCLEVNVAAGTADLSDAVKHVGTNYTAYWGRWSDQPVTINQGAGDETYNAAELLYAYSEDLTPDTSAAAIGSSTLSYNKILGSNPIDQDGVSGTLGAVSMDINFGSQQITSFNLNLSTADGDWDAHLPYVDGTTIQEAVALSGAVNSFAVEGLASDPTGGITAAGTSSRYDIYGDISTALLGPNADAVLGTYNLSVVDTLGAPQDAEAIGTFLLEPDPI